MACIVVTKSKLPFGILIVVAAHHALDRIYLSGKIFAEMEFRTIREKQDTVNISLFTRTLFDRELRLQHNASFDVSFHKLD